jgi:hypothetical protein
MKQWKRLFPPASDAEIAQFEKAHGVALPPRYRSYLKSANGGQPDFPLGFVIPGIGDKVVLGVLYGISGDADNSSNLREALAESNDDFPNGYIPVGEDPGGNQLLLSTSGQHQDEIFFRDRVGFLAKRTGKAIFKISDSIDAFIESLQAIEDA